MAVLPWKALLSTVLVLLAHKVTCDSNSGCPQYGCLTWGTFSLSGPIPVSNGEVKWSSHLETVNGSNTGTTSTRGCISNQDFVVCVTQRGYTAFDPSTGEQLWTYNSTMTSPFLPLMDIYGDVIGSDPGQMVYISNDGKAKNPLPTKDLHPNYGLVVTNNSILLLTSSKTETAQIFSYDTDGIIDGAFELRGSWERMNGTFVPCSQPIIAGSRAYIVAHFVPNGTDPAKTSNWLRLFAVDLLRQLAPRIRLAWWTNFEMESDVHDVSGAETREPIVSFYNGTVYVNRAWPSVNNTHSPYNSTIYAFTDHGNFSSRQFKADSHYGPMAVYDTYEEPIQSQSSDSHVMWVATNSPATLTGHSTQDGSVQQVININDVTKLGPLTTITSKLTITRQSSASSRDVLVMGVATVEDSAHEAYIVAIDADPTKGKAGLLWSAKVSEPRSVEDSVIWSVDGMVVNTAQNNPKNPKLPMLGLMATVTETGKQFRKSYVKGVF